MSVDVGSTEKALLLSSHPTPLLARRDPEDPSHASTPPPSTPLGSNFPRLIGLAAPTLLTIALPSVLSLTDTYLASYTDTFGTRGVSNLEVVSSTIPYVNFVNFLFSASFAGTVVPSLIGGELEDNPALPTTLLRLAVKASLLPIATLPILAFAIPQSYLPFAAICILTFPLTFTLGTSLSILRGTLDTRTPASVLIQTCLTNLVLSFAITHVGLPVQGAALIGIGTMIAEGGGFYRAFKVLGDRELIEMPKEIILGKEAADSHLISTIHANVGASFLRSLLLQATLLGSSAYLTAQTNYIEAHVVASSLWFFSSSVTDSVAGGVQTLTAKEKDWEIGRDGIIMGVVIGAILGSGIMIASPYLGFLTPGDEGVQADLQSIIGFVAGMQVLNGLVFVGDGILQGLKLFKYEAKVMTAAAIGGTTVAALAIRGGTDELVAVWTGISSMQLVRVSLIAWKLKFGDAFSNNVLR